MAALRKSEEELRRMLVFTPQLVSVNEEPSHNRLYANRGLIVRLLWHNW
jgi:hypothetical protein